MVTVFNTQRADPNVQAIAFHIYNAAFDQTAVARLGVRPLPDMTVIDPGGEFSAGTRMRMSGAGVPMFSGLALTHLEVTLGNQAGAHDDNVVTARCDDADSTWNFKGEFGFGNAALSHFPTDTHPCLAAGGELTVTPTGDGTGTVTGPGISCPGDCTEPYASGQMVSLTATPGSGSTFNPGWGGDCTGTTTCELTIDGDKAVTAGFLKEPNARTLTVSSSGSGAGTVTGPGINCPGDCTEVYGDGEMVTLVAAPGGGTTYGGWSACPGTVSTTTITNDTCTVTMNSDKSATASFLLQRTLTAGKTGTGFGTVSSAPSGISCGGDCSESFNQNSIVTLTAMPIGGSTFTGWSACPGTVSTTTITNDTCTVTMDSAKSVSAGFSAGTFTFVVNTLADGVDATLDGDCASSIAGNPCTLRAALTEANATPVTDNITFSVTGEHQASGLSFSSFVITTPMTITGNGSAPGGTALDGGGTKQVVNVGVNSGQVRIEDMTIRDGRNNFTVGMTPTASGGGIQVVGSQMVTPASVTLEDVNVTANAVEANGANGVALGGGVFAGFNTNLTLIDSTVSGNTVTAASKGSGAGIYALGNASITDSTVSGNLIQGAATIREGAGIATDLAPVLNLNRSTVSNNNTGPAGLGGGIRTGAGSAAITNSTVSDNTAGSGGGGGIQANIGTVISASTFAGNSAPGGTGADVSATLDQTTVKSSILASPGACGASGSGSLVSAGRNLDNGTSCGFGTTNGDLQNSNPMLGPLQDNGDPTFTRALLPGSPAIDAGAAVVGVTVDQRGIARPQGAGCDIGAFELEQANDAASCVASAVPQPPAQPAPPPAAVKKKCKKGQKLKKGKCVKKRKPKKK